MCSSGGGALCQYLSNPTFENVIFAGNFGKYGGGVYCYQSSPVFVNCTFCDNTVEFRGGGARCVFSTATFSGCTFSNNDSPFFGAGLSAEIGSHLVVENTIVAYNTTMEGVAVADSSTVTLACSDLYGNEGGDWVGAISNQAGVNGNICLDPIFCDHPSGNYTLQSDSPCLAFSPPNSSCDILGAWPQGCLATAVEWSDGIPTLDLLSSCAPNPFRLSTQITYAVPETSSEPRVRLRVIDLQGRVIRTLVDLDRVTGVYRVGWDGTNHMGEPIANGIYFYQVNWNGRTETKRLSFVR